MHLEAELATGFLFRFTRNFRRLARLKDAPVLRRQAQSLKTVAEHSRTISQFVTCTKLGDQSNWPLSSIAC